MKHAELLEQLLHSWRVNNAISVELLRRIPAKGLSVVPPASKGRTVADQFAHLNNVRVGWLGLNGVKGKALRRFRSSKKAALTGRIQLVSAFRASGAAVEDLLQKKLEEGARVKMFKGRPVLWLAYLISHESHHRGQIALALKQNGMKLPEKVALGTLWHTWIFGKAK